MFLVHFPSLGKTKTNQPQMAPRDNTTKPMIRGRKIANRIAAILTKTSLISQKKRKKQKTDEFQ
jgi:hypothetical protein